AALVLSALALLSKLSPPPPPPLPSKPEPVVSAPVPVPSPVRPAIPTTPTTAEPLGSQTVATATGEALLLEGRISQGHPAPGASYWAKLELIARPQARGHVPVRMLLVLDRSGSMRGEKMTRTRQAAEALISALEPNDSLGIIAFDNELIRF